MKGKLVTIFAILLVFTLIFAACRRDGDPTDPEATPTEAPTPTPAPTPEATPEPTPEPIVIPDLDGRVIRFGSQAMYWAQSIGAHNEYGWVTPAYDAPLDQWMRYENRQRVEAMFNIVIEPVHIPGGEIVDRLTTAHLAGYNYVDILYTVPGTMINLFNRGIIVPVDEIARPDSDVFTNQLYMWPGFSLGGQLLGVTRPVPVFNKPVMFVNMDLVNALGLPNPVELFNNGDWTWEAMRNIIGLGTTGDYYGFGGPLGPFIVNMIAANGSMIMDPVTTELNFDTPAVMAAIEFAIDIIDNGWLFIPDPELENYILAGPHNAAFTHQRTVLHFVNGAVTINAERIAAGGTLPMAFDVLPLPTGPLNTVGTTFTHAGRNMESVVFGAEDPEILFWILEELFKWPGEEYWIEHESDHGWARNWAPNEDAVQRLGNNGFNISRDMGPLTVMGAGYFNSMLLAYYSGEMTVAAFIEHNRAEREQMRRDWFGLD